MKEQRGAQYIGKNRTDQKDDTLPDVTNSNGMYESVRINDKVKRRVRYVRT